MIPLLLSLVLVSAFAGGYFYGRSRPARVVKLYEDGRKHHWVDQTKEVVYTEKGNLAFTDGSWNSARKLYDKIESVKNAKT